MHVFSQISHSYFSSQAKIRSRNEYGLSAETILDLFQTFDIRDVTTQASTQIFRKIPADFQDEQPSSTSVTVKNDNLMVNSEPLSTNEEKSKENTYTK